MSDHNNMKNMDMHHDAHHEEMHHEINMNHCDMESMHHDMSNHGDMMMHGGHMMHMGNLKRKFWVSLILMIPILLMSPMMGMRLPFQITFTGSEYLVAILSTILFFLRWEAILQWC